MKASESHRTKAFVMPLAVTGAVLSLPPLYVLSIGPFAWLVAHGYLSKQSGWIYAPLGVVALSWPPFDKFMAWYLSFWQ